MLVKHVICDGGKLCAFWEQIYWWEAILMWFFTICPSLWQTSVYPVIMLRCWFDIAVFLYMKHPTWDIFTGRCILQLVQLVCVRESVWIALFLEMRVHITHWLQKTLISSNLLVCSSISGDQTLVLQIDVHNEMSFFLQLEETSLVLNLLCIMWLCNSCKHLGHQEAAGALQRKRGLWSPFPPGKP